VTDREAVQRIVSDVRPDEIYHLAGLTHPTSGTAGEFYQVNLDGILNLLEAVRERVPEAKVLLVGSAYAYGNQDRPIPKTTVSIPLTTMELLKPQQISWDAFMLCRACALCARGRSTILDLVRRRTSCCRAWCSSLPRLRQE
jgi:nucleoside-diphosphate-sugar epimerase